MTKLAPTGVKLRTYQVGFGDCHLLQFCYAKGRSRNVLIDFGTTGIPKGAGDALMTMVAEDIAKVSNGKLDVVVASHRHADHISGFATNAAGTAPGDIIKKLSPSLVLQPWTEDPRLATNALGPSDKSDISDRRAFARSLQSMHAISETALNFLDTRAAKSLSSDATAQLRFLGEDNLKNKSAVENLMAMGRRSCYAHYGSRLALASILPGVKVHVLGPPTLRQSKAIRKQRSSDPSEFWQLARAQLGTDVSNRSGPELFPGFRSESGGKLRFSARWLARRMKAVPGEQLLELVRILDKQMNNTSLILLFDTGKEKLLFPGDAQIENWNYALSQGNAKSLLADVDLYKVGHHGSRNATPRSLWALFEKRGPVGKRGRLTTVLSTMPGKHGDKRSKTEVPRQTLLNELDAESNLSTTHRLAAGVQYLDITFR